VDDLARVATRTCAPTSTTSSTAMCGFPRGVMPGTTTCACRRTRARPCASPTSRRPPPLPPAAPRIHLVAAAPTSPSRWTDRCGRSDERALRRSSLASLPITCRRSGHGMRPKLQEDQEQGAANKRGGMSLPDVTTPPMPTRGAASTRQHECPSWTAFRSPLLRCRRRRWGERPGHCAPRSSSRCLWTSAPLLMAWAAAVAAAADLQPLSLPHPPTPPRRPHAATTVARQHCRTIACPFPRRNTSSRVGVEKLRGAPPPARPGALCRSRHPSSQMRWKMRRCAGLSSCLHNLAGTHGVLDLVY
jgi:hypothetical protein